MLHYLYRRPDNVIDNLSFFAGEVVPTNTRMASKLITKCKSLELEVSDKLQNASRSRKKIICMYFEKSIKDILFAG